MERRGAGGLAPAEAIARPRGSTVAVAVAVPSRSGVAPYYATASPRSTLHCADATVLGHRDCAPGTSTHISGAPWLDMMIDK
jgi:hypothetical protein